MRYHSNAPMLRISNHALAQFGRICGSSDPGADLSRMMEAAPPADLRRSLKAGVTRIPLEGCALICNAGAVIDIIPCQTAMAEKRRGGTPPRRSGCDICGSVFGSRKAMLRHKLTHIAPA